MVFSPLAYLKLQFFLHAGETEVGGFGISCMLDPLHIEDFVTVKQLASLASVQLEDAAVADLFDNLVDQGVTPDRFGRVWCHTHPGDSPQPSSTDEDTFDRVFGSCDWSVMFILAKGGKTYARLALAARNGRPGVSLRLPVSVDWAGWAENVIEHGPQLGDLLEHWQDEYGTNIFRAHIHAPVLDPVLAGAMECVAYDPWREEYGYELGQRLEGLPA